MAATPSEANDEVRAAVDDFVRGRTSAQFYTINREGYPVGRTMGVNLNQDGSIDLIQATDNGRVRQVDGNPHVLIEWNDGTDPIPKVVFMKGMGQTFGGDALVAAYGRRIDFMAARSGREIPRKSPEEVTGTLTGIHITPTEWRVEGFGKGAEVHLWKP